jgi:hypothetical protein
MPIKINSTGGGSVSIDVPSTGGTFTLTAPANNATIFTTAGGAITGNVSVAGVATFSSNVTFSSNNVSIGGQALSSAVGMRNRIINGDMRIDQRNVGASVTLPAGSGAYSFAADRFAAGRAETGTATFQQSSTAPAGFANSIVWTTGTASTPAAGDNTYVFHPIEGYNVADLDFGKSTAKTVTLSFWVRSSLTGTYSGSLSNGSGNRYYVFSYTISSANTWEYKSITIPGDTTGTWGTTNGRGLNVIWNMGYGSTYLGTAGSWGSSVAHGTTGSVNVANNAGATWYLTGVQLEVGSVATPFEFRSYTTELALCQRYFCKSFRQSVAPAHGADYQRDCVSGGLSSYTTNTAYLCSPIFFPIIMRTVPTVTAYSSSVVGSSTTWNYYNGIWNNFATLAYEMIGDIGFRPNMTGSWSTNQDVLYYGAYTASAEL